MNATPAHPVHFFDLEEDQVKQWVQDQGLPRFRAAQLLQWVYGKGVADFAQMTDFSAADRQRLAGLMVFETATPLRHQTATDGTEKLLLQWPEELTARNTDNPAQADGGGQKLHSLPLRNPSEQSNTSECVMIPAKNPDGKERRTACISSQVGCPVGCRFCASGVGGLDRNLTVGQITEQIHQLNRLPGIERITNVVFMGMGEPLANFANVTAAIRRLTAPWGFNISARKVTLSTVGLPAQIRRLAEIDLPITLALSLHAPNDTLRRQLIPWAEYVTIDQLVDACRHYFNQTGREVTFEYILLHGVSHTPACAHEFAAVAKRVRANVNLIRYNEVKGLPFNRPVTEDVGRFQHILRSAGVNAHIRASRGRDIAAACGQLRYQQKAGQTA